MASIRRAPRQLLVLPIRQAQCSATSQRFASTDARSPGPTVPDLAKESSLSAPTVKTAGSSAETVPSILRPEGSFWRPPPPPPMYRRGPLHPVQPPPSSDPLARDFVPGPFNHPRLRQTYESTVAVDLLTLAYQHPEPKDSSATGAEEGEEADEEDATSASFGGPHEERRLRRWDGSSPYHKNRPLRPARGRHGLRPIEHPITFRNVPRIESVSLSMFEPDAIQNPDRLTVAMAVMRNITMTVPEIIRIKTPVPAWRTIKGRPAGVKTRIWGDRAYEFVDKCVNFVFPRIKEWPGVKASTGDMSGNLSWGFTPKDIILFPEVEANYDMYPPRMIPGCRVTVHTTARSDRHALLLLQALGVPFYHDTGKKRR